MTETFNNKWTLWNHIDKDNWTLSGFNKIYTISNMSDFWKLYNNFNKIDIYNNQLFLMKNDIPPLWEDTNNINGGCWSYKVSDNNVLEMWEMLSTYLVCETLNTNNLDEILGLSISSKKNNNFIIKIWNKNSKYNSLKYIHENILSKWTTNMIYIAHIPNK
jgi:hypothetical protein